MSITEDELRHLREACEAAPPRVDGRRVSLDPRTVIGLIDEIERLRAGILLNQATLTKWAVARGGDTPSAIVASALRKLIGYDGPALSDEDLEIALRSREVHLAKETK